MSMGMGMGMGMIADFIFGHPLFAPKMLKSSDTDDVRTIENEIAPEDIENATIVTSLVKDELVPSRDLAPVPLGIPGEPIHTIMLDLDVRSFYVESSTPGHAHLYIDVKVGWSKYSQLLRLLGEIGVLEWNYVDVSLMRKATSLRLPWVKK